MLGTPAAQACTNRNRRHNDCLNSKRRRTLKAVFTAPASPTIGWADIGWADIESLLIAAGARVIEGAGSAVRVEPNGLIARFHRPHPDKQATRYQVKDARAFLAAIGVKP